LEDVGAAPRCCNPHRCPYRSLHIW
jgi:hypothetical protein